MEWLGTTWILNAQPDISERITPSATEGSLFISNGIYYDKMDIANPQIVYSHGDTDEIVYASSGMDAFTGWRSDVYQSITFVAEPDIDKAAFETWLSNNATPYVPPESSYVVSGDDLESIAEAIRAKTGTSSELEFPTGFVNAINDIDIMVTSDATAYPSDIKNGKTAYARGQKITGTYVPRVSNVTLYASKSYAFALQAGVYGAGQRVLNYKRPNTEYWDSNTVGTVRFTGSEAVINKLSVGISANNEYIFCSARETIYVTTTAYVSMQYTAKAEVTID